MGSISSMCREQATASITAPRDLVFDPSGCAGCAREDPQPVVGFRTAAQQREQTGFVLERAALPHTGAIIEAGGLLRAVPTLPALSLAISMRAKVVESEGE